MTRLLVALVCVLALGSCKLKRGFDAPTLEEFVARCRALGGRVDVSFHERSSVCHLPAGEPTPVSR